MNIDFVDHSTIELVDCNADDVKVAKAAWVSNYEDSPYSKDVLKLVKMGYHPLSNYNAEVGNAHKHISGLINFLYRNRHMSPFEHGQFTFLIETPIFVAREFMRHRTFSYNEMSGRYKELKPVFYLPASERPIVQQGKIGSYTFTSGSDNQYGTMFDEIAHSSGAAWASYQKMLDAGIAKEIARMVLPVNIMTRFYATCNPRNLMQFLELRNSPHALAEIRAVAEGMENIFKDEMPKTHQAYSRELWRRQEIEDFFDKNKTMPRAVHNTSAAKQLQDMAYETYKDNIEGDM